MTPSSRARWPRMESPARWKLTTNSPRPLLPILAWLFTRSQCGAARRCRAFFLRLGNRCACRHCIDRMLATDPKSRPPSSHSRMLRRKRQAHRRPRPASTPTTCRIASGGSEDLPPRSLGTTERPPPEPPPESSFFTPHVGLMRSPAASLLGEHIARTRVWPSENARHLIDPHASPVEISSALPGCSSSSERLVLLRS